MAAVEVTISGVLFDKYARTTRPVVLIGEASLTGLGVGGGPMPPGQGGGSPGDPPGIWGGPIDPYPDHGLPGRPPGTWGGAGEGFPTPPIYLPPQVPPGMKPPEPPQPGDPTTAVPGNWPVQPVTPPPYIIVQYPGIGPVYVAPPETAQPTK